jgi:hypothetical protein
MLTPMPSTQAQEGLPPNVLPAPQGDPAALDSASMEVERPLTGRQVGQIDDRQDQLVARDSADGRPPSHRQRFAEWRWFVIVGPLLFVGGVAYALIRGVGVEAIAVGVVLSLGYFMLAGGSAWGVGALRWKEERAARKQATQEVRELDASLPPRR